LSWQLHSSVIFQDNFWIGSTNIGDSPIFINACYLILVIFPVFHKMEKKWELLCWSRVTCIVQMWNRHFFILLTSIKTPQTDVFTANVTYVYFILNCLIFQNGAFPSLTFALLELTAPCVWIGLLQFLCTVIFWINKWYFVIIMTVDS
jgi:hypothetical protein